MTQFMHSSWKLSEATKREIAQLYRDGIKVRIIATHYGISTNAVSAIAINRGFRRRTRAKGVERLMRPLLKCECAL